MEIKIDYSLIINHPEESIINALKDFKSYPMWWPKKFRIKYCYKNNKNILTFFPVSGINITWDIFSDKNQIKTNYTKGLVNGYGIFKTRRVNEYKTEVYYNIVVSPRIKLIKTIPTPLVKAFEKIHVFHIKQLLKNLEKHLN